MNLNTVKIFIRIIFIFILINSSLIISAQSIYKEFSLDLDELVGGETPYEICAELDYDGDSKYEILLKEDFFHCTFHFIDIKNQILKQSFTTEVFENFFSKSDYELPIRFKGNKSDDIHFDQFQWPLNRIYDPIHDDIIKLNFKIDNAIVTDLNNDGYPEIIGKENYTDSLKVFSFINSCTYKNLISVGFQSLSIHVAQMDQDQQKEIVMIGNSSCLIVDPFTLKTEEIILPIGHPFQMESFISNSKNKLFYIFHDGGLGLYNVEENKIEGYLNLNSYRSPSMKVFYLIDSLNISKPYIAILDQKLTILDEKLTTIFTLDTLNINLPYFKQIRFIINDFDEDKLPNFIIVEENKISNYEVSGLGSYYNAFQIHDQYPKNNQKVPSSFEIKLVFNEAINLDSFYHNVYLVESDGTNVNNLSIKSENDIVFNISPHLPLDEGKYSLVVKKSLRSKSGKRLDLNNDNKISYYDDFDYILNFQIVNQSLLKPTITPITEIFDSLYTDTKHEMIFEINSNNANTPFKSIKSGFENDTLSSIVPIDGVLNNSLETLQLLISTEGRKEGTENYKIVVETINNLKDSLVFPIKIISLQGFPFPMIGVNLS